MNETFTGYPSIDKPWLKNYSENSVQYISDCKEQNAYQFMAELNKHHQQYIALEYLGVRITYSKLFKEIEKVAKALRANGKKISKGDFVTICLPNIPEIIYFIYALNRIGATACLIDPCTNAEGILQRSNDSKSKLLITITDIIENKINFIAEELISGNIITVSPSDSASIRSVKSIAVKILYTFKKTKCKSNKFIRYRDFIIKGEHWSGNFGSENSLDDPAAIVYTSGTTGTSKGVVLSNKNIIASKKLIEYGASEVERNASFLGVIPFFSSYGALTGMNNSLCCGWKIILIPQFKPSQFGQLIIKHNVVSALGVPRFWDDLQIWELIQTYLF